MPGAIQIVIGARVKALIAVSVGSIARLLAARPRWQALPCAWRPKPAADQNSAMGDSAKGF